MNKNKKSKKQKGYIGAIGDDLPSLIPLFLGIVLFFAVFINTYNVYKANTDLYSAQNEGLRIALILKEEPLIINHDFFMKICNKVETQYKWTAFIVDNDLNSSNFRPINIIRLRADQLENGATKEIISYEMENANGTEEKKIFVCGDFDEFLNIPYNQIEYNVVNYMFPLARQVEVNAIPVRLYVVVWKT